MSDWRSRLQMSASDIANLSAENMAATRIMKSVGSSVKNIGGLCKRFGIPYREEESSFHRAVQIFREVYREASRVFIFDAKSGKRPESIFDDLMDDPRPSVVFFRIDATDKTPTDMVALVRDRDLPSSLLGEIVIQPGIQFMAKRGNVQLWMDRDPVRLLKSFSNKEN